MRNLLTNTRPVNRDKVCYKRWTTNDLISIFVWSDVVRGRRLRDVDVSREEIKRELVEEYKVADEELIR